MKVSMILAAILAAGLGMGCQATKTASASEENCVAAPAGGNKPGKIVVNTVCPVMMSDAVDENVSVDYKGKKIGFCCKGCVTKFNAMNEAAKDKVLATAMTYAK